MHVITSTKGVCGGGGEEEVGPLIRADTDEDGEKREQLTARGMEKQELGPGTGPHASPSSGSWLCALHRVWLPSPLCSGTASQSPSACLVLSQAWLLL